MNRLERIVAVTRREVERRKRSVAFAELRAAASARAQADPARRFTDAIAAPGLSVIAEHKRRSPSAGAIREDLALEQVVGAYERGGARALSVLTDGPSFGGALGDLLVARRASQLPILRKDFIVDPYQVLESYAHGADAILLIVAALSPCALADLHARARGMGLDVLVEVHDERELVVAMSLAPEAIGINNRDLTTLTVDTERTYELAPRVHGDALVVAESGFSHRAQLAQLAQAGVNGVLIGEALMRAPEPESACRELTGVAA